jgi:U3 small nucleolar RNA-associated protein 23
VPQIEHSNDRANMRQKRAKQYRKQMQVLRTTFKFKTPIQILVDDTTITEAANTNYDLLKGLNSVVQMEAKFFITQCCIEHLYESKNQPAIDLAKKMEKRRCGHKGTQTSFDCIKSITNVDGENKYRYLVTTQDESLRTSLRNIAGVPLCFLHRSVLIMEPLSKVTKRVVTAVERMKLTQGLNSVDAGKRLREVDEEEVNTANDTESKPHVKKAKKVKGVNPLAMKKKQKKPNQNDASKKKEEPTEVEEATKKRRRRKHGKSSNKEEEEGEGEVKESESMTEVPVSSSTSAPEAVSNPAIETTATVEE